jgi:hypothetical protein
VSAGTALGIVAEDRRGESLVRLIVSVARRDTETISRT